MSQDISYLDLLSSIFNETGMASVPEASGVETENIDVVMLDETVCVSEGEDLPVLDEPVLDEPADSATPVDDDDPVEDTEPRRIGRFQFKKNNNKNRINTTSIFDNTNFYNGGLCSEEIVSTAPLAISPVVEEQYDYSVAEDIVLLQDRKETNQIIYDIYMHAPFSALYRDGDTGIIKIPKDDIPKVFYYVKDKLMKRKKVSAFETVIAINEFFDFNYDYIIKKVVSSKMMSEILEDYYNNMGMKERIDELSSSPPF